MYVYVYVFLCVFEIKDRENRNREIKRKPDRIKSILVVIYVHSSIAQTGHVLEMGTHNQSFANYLENLAQENDRERLIENCTALCIFTQFLEQ